MAFQREFAVAYTLSPDATRDIAVLIHVRMLTDEEIPIKSREKALAFDIEELVAMVTPDHYVVWMMTSHTTPVDIEKQSFSFWCWGDSLSDPDPTKSSMPYSIKKTTFKENFYGAIIAVK